MGGIAAWMLAACAGPADAPDAPAEHPLDDLLAFDHLQAKGTHNSYHLQTSDIPAWAYDHLPLERQLGEQGVRQFELDASFDEDLGEHAVFHVPVIDEGTTCPTLTACAAVLEGWSRAHPAHHPLLVLIETKDAWDPDTGPSRLDALDAELLAAWPRERLVTPDEIRGDHPDLRTAIETDGWPMLGALRGRALFVLHDTGARRDAYVASLDGRPLFPDAKEDLDLPYAAVHTINDPWDPRIGEAVDRGHLVRTRADEDCQQARDDDPTMRDQALASGAHFVSTDFPGPVEATPYRVDIPDGSPSRCNPRSAPDACTSAAVEDPEIVGR